jgi:hypothetical protein
MLDQFAAYLDGVGAERQTIGHAVSWAKQPAGAAPVWWAIGLSTALGFVRFLSASDPAIEVPPAGVFPRSSHRAVPYIYPTRTSTGSGKLLAGRALSTGPTPIRP